MPRFVHVKPLNEIGLLAEFGVTTVTLPEDPQKVDVDAAKMKELFDSLIARRRSYDDAYNATLNNEHLTQRGKEDRILDLGRTTLNTLAGDESIAVAKQHLAEMDHAIRVKPAHEVLRTGTAAPNAAAIATREREVRDWLFKLDDLRANELLNQAVDNRDELLFGAFVNVPEAMWMLPPDVIKAAIRRWEENGAPETAAKAEQLRSAIAMAEGALTATRQHVASTAGIPLEPSYIVL